MVTCTQFKAALPHVLGNAFGCADADHPLCKALKAEGIDTDLLTMSEAGIDSLTCDDSGTAKPVP